MRGVAITGAGAVTSVGLDARTTCASIRAGLSRPAPLDTGTTLDLLDYQAVPLTGHPAGELARGFSGVGRWLQLAAVALNDLCASAHLPRPRDNPEPWQDLTLCVALPFLGERYLPDPIMDDGAIHGALVPPLLRRVSAYCDPSDVRVLARGRVGALRLISDAAQAIASGSTRRAIVLAVDSQVDRPSLTWLDETGRLKSDQRPFGLSPGEGSCALLLEHERFVRSGHDAAPVRLAAVHTAREANAFSQNERSQGEALLQALREALAESGTPTPYPARLLTDLNGESWRAHELGRALVRALREGLVDDQPPQTFAQSTGDLGAVASLLQLAIARSALTRGYAQGDRVLCTCSDEEGWVGATVLTRLVS